jgi:hypothetical protein
MMQNKKRRPPQGTALETVARDSDPIREKYSILSCRYPDQVYFFMGFNLVTTPSSFVEICL